MIFFLLRKCLRLCLCLFSEFRPSLFYPQTTPLAHPNPFILCHILFPCHPQGTPPSSYGTPPSPVPAGWQRHLDRSVESGMPMFNSPSTSPTVLPECSGQGLSQERFSLMDEINMKLVSLFLSVPLFCLSPWVCLVVVSDCSNGNVVSSPFKIQNYFTWWNVAVSVFWHTSLFTPFYSALVSVSVFMTLSTVFHSINSPNNSPFSHFVLPVLALPYWSFQLYISSGKSPSALI